MNWIARYAAAVKRYLPRDRAADVSEELQLLLNEKAAEREDELGRPLTEPEILGLIKDHGHPLKVASAYRATGPLISEDWYPIYALALKYVLILLFAVYSFSVLWICLTDKPVIWMEFWGGAITTTFVLVGELTLGFHLLDRYFVSKKVFANWNPANLAQLPILDSESPPLAVTMLLCVCLVAWMGVLSMIPIEHSVALLLGETNDRALTLAFWLKIQILLQLGVYVVLMFRPYWTPGRRLVIMLSDFIVVAGIAICLQIDPIKFQGLYPQIAAEIGIGEGSTYLLGFWLIGLLMDLVSQGRKAYRQLAAGRQSE